jgi:hypothetical protein
VWKCSAVIFRTNLDYALSRCIPSYLSFRILAAILMTANLGSNVDDIVSRVSHHLPLYAIVAILLTNNMTPRHLLTLHSSVFLYRRIHVGQGSLWCSAREFHSTRASTG